MAMNKCKYLSKANRFSCLHCTVINRVLNSKRLTLEETEKLEIAMGCYTDAVKAEPEYAESLFNKIRSVGPACAGPIIFVLFI
jgi:hypothetical protein